LRGVVKGYAAVLAAAIVFAACGDGGSDEQQIETSIKEYMAAFANGDGDEACDHLTDAAREKMERGLKAMVGEASCDALPKVVDQLEKLDRDELNKLHEVEVEGIKVTGDTATAWPTYHGERADQATLRRVDGEWKLDQDFFED
jgi:limonene-1,2-epoxide hydrolase